MQSTLVRDITVSLFALASAFVVASAQAADMTPPSAPVSTAPADSLGQARALIKQDKWVAAIDELKRLSQAGSADWNNLMGYSHRKAKVPDLVAAERYYDSALRIDPNHRGALEYSGELFLQKGNLASAEARLSALARVCGACEEHAELKKAVESFKANDGKVAAKQ